MTQQDRLAYTVEQAVESTGLTRTRLYRAFADGSLKSFRCGRRRMISATALQGFIEALEKADDGRAAA